MILKLAKELFMSGLRAFFTNIAPLGYLFAILITKCAKFGANCSIKRRASIRVMAAAQLNA